MMVGISVRALFPKRSDPERRAAANCVRVESTATAVRPKFGLRSNKRDAIKFKFHEVLMCEFFEKISVHTGLGWSIRGAGKNEMPDADDECELILIIDDVSKREFENKNRARRCSALASYMH
jgi:hypothetical protein